MGYSKVYFGSMNHGKIAQEASLAHKLELMIDALDFSTLGKGDKVAVKMHLGYTDGAQTIHPFYVRRIVERIKKVGAYPFVTDNPTSVYNAAERGYTQETCGCPLVPVSGIKELYGYDTEINYRTVHTMKMAGVLHDSDALVNLSHVKSQNNVGYAAAVKNLGVGGYNGSSRWQHVHGIFNSTPSFQPEKCSPDHAETLVKSCPYGYISYKKEKHELAINRGRCYNSNCLECVKADEGVNCLNMRPEDFETFQELITIASKKILDRFDAKKVFHFNFLMDMTPTCDCMGVIQPQVVPDIGIVGGRDIVAVEQASIDLVAKEDLILSKIPPYFKHLNTDKSKNLHPFQRLWGPMKDPGNVGRFGEKYNLGSSKYELVEILSPEETLHTEASHSFERGQPSFS
jgi:uncharacterized Fe-S center protein